MERRRIGVLGEHIANKIAAGEVIERPASVVKELIENALDAGATRIEVEIEAGGKELIRITDDGSGIAAEEMALAFQRHATSKIVAADDLFNVGTLGFRGEALPSVAAVADVELRSRPLDAATGALYAIVGGRPATAAPEPTGTPPGTSVTVRRLFFNTPARYKFLRTDGAERRRVADVVARNALAWPGVSFRFVADGRTAFTTPGDGALLSAAREIYGADTARALVPVDAEWNGMRVSGYVGKPELRHGNRDRISIFLNRRWIQSNAIAHAIQRGYETLLPPRRFPVAIIHITVDTAAVDVNVHPAKTEVRFQNDSDVYRAVLRAVRAALLDANLIGTLPLPDAAHPGASKQRSPELPASNDVVQVRGSGGDLVPAAKERPLSPVAHTAKLPFTPGGAAAREGSVRDALPHADALTIKRDGVGETFADPRCGPPPGKGGAPAAAPPVAEDVRHALREMTVVGQLHRTFILGETKAGLWIIDQHVAHERLLYELFLREEAARENPMQRSLVPITINVTPDRAGLIEKYAGELERLGFELEPFGGLSYLLRGAPVVGGRGNTDAARVTAVLEEVLDACESIGRWSAHEAAATLACRNAVKAGQWLNDEQMSRLVVALADADNPFACPHGRPVVIEVGRPDLERRFGRR